MPIDCKPFRKICRIFCFTTSLRKNICVFRIFSIDKRCGAWYNVITEKQKSNMKIKVENYRRPPFERCRCTAAMKMRSHIEMAKRSAIRINERKSNVLPPFLISAAQVGQPTMASMTRITRSTSADEAFARSETIVTSSGRFFSCSIQRSISVGVLPPSSVRPRR